MTAATGIAPLDRRTGGLGDGGLYLLSSPATPARTAAVIQFVAAGLERGEPTGLVSRVPVERLLRSAERFGRPLETAWRTGGLRLLGFSGEYEARLRRAGSADEVFDELTSLLEPLPGRLAFDPGTPLWEGRGDVSAASAFLDFVDESSATTLATTTRDLTGELPPSTEMVAQAARGSFRLSEQDGGLLRLSIHELDGGRPERSDVTLQLRDGRGLAAPAEAPRRRSSDRPAGSGDRMLRLELDGAVSDEIESWLEGPYRVTRTDDPLDLVARLQTDRSYGLVLVSLTRERLADARKACRICGRLRPNLPVVVISEEPLRASDRADLLDDGADECMTGRINVAELASRLELAVDRGGGRVRPEEREGGEPPAAPESERRDGPGGTAGRRTGPLPEEEFRRELRERLVGANPAVFTVVRFRTGDGGEIAERLSDLVRREEGDFVGRLGGASAVWLADTAPAEAREFVRRVRDVVEEEAGHAPVDAEVLGSTRDSHRLRDLLG